MTDRPNWGFELGSFKVRFHEPTAEEILNAYNENLLPKQERFRKMRKHADPDMGDPNMMMKLATEVATDQNLAFYSAATYEPHMSIAELRQLPGRTWSMFERFVDRMLGMGELKFRADGPGVDELGLGGETNDPAVMARIPQSSGKRTQQTTGTS